MSKLQEKLQAKVDELCADAEEERGYGSLDVCDFPNWDRDFWNYRHSITDAIMKRGYNVESGRSHGVTTIKVTKVIILT